MLSHEETPDFAPCPNVYWPFSAPRILLGAPVVTGCVGASLFLFLCQLFCCLASSYSLIDKHSPGGPADRASSHRHLISMD